MGNLNSAISTLCFIGAGMCTFLLFGGLFSASWNNVVQSLWLSAFVLVLGTLVPLLCILGIGFAIRGFYKYETLSTIMSIINLVAILFTILSVSMYYTAVFSSVVELYKIKLGIGAN